MPRPLLCIDIDNVIAHTDVVLREVIRRYTGGRVNLTYADVLEFNYWECKDCTGEAISKEDWTPIHLDFSKPEILGTIRPTHGIQEHLAALRRRYEIHLVTARISEARPATAAWLTDHEIPFDKLLFSGHGEKHQLLHPYFAAVEDDYGQGKAFADLGVRAYLLEHPWNKSKPKYPLIQWAANWEQLCEELMQEK